MKHRDSKLRSPLRSAVLVVLAASALLAGSRPPQTRISPPRVPSAASQSYTFQVIDPPAVFCPTSGSINDQRLAIVAYSHEPECTSFDTMLWQNGQFLPLPVVLYPANTIISMGDLNNRGTIFGNFGDVNIQHGALVEPGSGLLTLLPDIPGKTQNYGQRISDSGRGVGLACEGNWYNWDNCDFWIWNGSYSFFDFIPGISVARKWPTGINNRGQILWTIYDTDWYAHAYLQDGNRSLNLDVPGAALTIPDDINNSGDVLVTAFAADYSTQNYLWRTGSFTLLPDVPSSWGSIQTYFTGMNNRGDYVGFYFDASPIRHAFVALKK